MNATFKRLALSALGLIWLAPQAWAQSPGQSYPIDRPSVRVSLADLNLASEEGMQTLTSRVDDAVRRVCGGSFISVPLWEQRIVTRCQRDAHADAWRQVERHQARAQVSTGTQNASTASRPTAH